MALVVDADVPGAVGDLVCEREGALHDAARVRLLVEPATNERLGRVEHVDVEAVRVGQQVTLHGDHSIAHCSVTGMQS